MNQNRIELAGLEPHEVARLVPLRPIAVAYRGSIAHGMYIPPESPESADDRDIITVYIPPLEAYFGRRAMSRGIDVKIGQWDSAAYEVQHMADLLMNNNPNVLSLLWTKSPSWLWMDTEGEMLIKSRDIFASKRAYHSFGGYAYSQLKRMTSFKSEEDGSVFGSCGCTGDFHASECEVAKEKGRGSQKRFATGFMGEKRKGLVEKFGYDCKNAAHLIRLLRLGIEFLVSGKMTVDRTEAGDADSLIAIKTGHRKLEDVQKEASRLFADLKAAHEGSKLPDEPNERMVTELMMDILCHAHRTAVAFRAHEVLVARGGLSG